MADEWGGDWGVCAPSATIHESEPTSDGKTSRPRDHLTPSDSDRRSPIIEDLLGLCRQRARAAAEGQKRSLDLLHEALASTLELFLLWRTEPSAQAEVELLFQENEISIDKRTRNLATPIVKLVFGKFCNRSNINRNAAALKYAYDQAVKPADLTEFVIANGGVARCAAMEARGRTPLQPGSAKQKLSAALEKRREDAVPISIPQVISLPSNRLFSLLVERDEIGQLRLLGSSVEEMRSVGRYLQIRRKASKASDLWG